MPAAPSPTRVRRSSRRALLLVASLGWTLLPSAAPSQDYAAKGFSIAPTSPRETTPENVAAGKSLYYRNCMFCHGDFLNGQGHFADALNPLPANFRDSGTISQLEEGYVYWRVATGGPALPQGATPWNSSMPVWQDFLSEQEIWQVVGFIYQASGSTPRTWEEH